MERLSILFISLFVIAVGCKQTNNTEPFVNNKLNKNWLQKIIRLSDSNYSKPYYRREFVTASYYMNKRDSTLCQVMRDSSQQVRQIIIEKNSIRKFYAQFYPNGQITAMVKLNQQGQLEGEATNFYPNGNVKSKGKYYNGLSVGIWEMYDENRKIIAKEEYDSNGQILKTTQY